MLREWAINRAERKSKPAKLRHGVSEIIAATSPVQSVFPHKYMQKM